MMYFLNCETSSHLPHPPPPIGGALGPAPWFILPIRLLPPGGPGGLKGKRQKQRILETNPLMIHFKVFPIVLIMMMLF